MPAKEPVVIGSPAFCQWSIRTTDALGRCLFRNDRFRTDQQRGLETSQRQTPTETVEKNTADSFCPVSYTHLDVYKRQV